MFDHLSLGRLSKMYRRLLKRLLRTTRTSPLGKSARPTNSFSQHCHRSHRASHSTLCAEVELEIAVMHGIAHTARGTRARRDVPGTLERHPVSWASDTRKSRCSHRKVRRSFEKIPIQGGCHRQAVDTGRRHPHGEEGGSAAIRPGEALEVVRYCEARGVVHERFGKMQEGR